MNAQMRTHAKTVETADFSFHRLRLMEIENQTDLSINPLTAVEVDGRGSKAGWPDAWLINAIRREPSDEEALDVLIGRYWKPLFARCRILTMNAEAASDLAQEAWLRVLRARGTLKPDGNFHGYITTIATNLWRDQNRSARRAGALADTKIESLDAADADDAQPVSLMEVVTEPNSLPPEEQILLKMDIDTALMRLSPHLRDVLVSRIIGGESAAEIGRRYERTEQTITTWIREAAREMKLYLGESRSAYERADQ